jgi:hypothetical protein
LPLSATSSATRTFFSEKSTADGTGGSITGMSSVRNIEKDSQFLKYQNGKIYAII